MGIWNGRVVPQLTQNIIKRLGGDMAWWHEILFFSEMGEAISEGRIERQKNTQQAFK
jgi:hypothetical protein